MKAVPRGDPARDPRRAARRRVALLAATLLSIPALLLSGCSQGVMNAQVTLDAMHAHGDYTTAAKFLDEPETVHAYEADEPHGKDAVLWQMERGSVALATGEPERCIQLLNRAEERTRYNYERNSGDILSTWVFNDTAPEYLPSAYEDQYVNVFKILAYLEAGQIEGKATAEARRFGDKARYLRDYLGRYYKAVGDETQRRFASDQRQARFDDKRLEEYAQTKAPPEFIESPLGAYLSAIAFLKTPGEAEAQSGAGNRLVDALNQQGALIGDVDPAPFSTLAQTRPDEVNTLVVAFSGRGPTKDKDRFGPIFLWYTSFHIVLPRLHPHPSDVAGAYLETSDGSHHDLHLIENMSRVACANFDEQMPAIYQRTMLRAFAKAAAVGVATVATDQAANHHHNNNSSAAAAQVGVRLIGFLYMWASEDADTRGWTMLPGQARVAHLKLPEGTTNARVVYTTRSGSTITGAWQPIEVTRDGLTTIVTHCPN